MDDCDICGHSPYHIYSTQAYLLGFNKRLLFLFKPIHQFSDDKMFDLERDAKEGHLPDFEERKKKRIIEVRNLN